MTCLSSKAVGYYFEIGEMTREGDHPCVAIGSDEPLRMKARKQVNLFYGLAVHVHHSTQHGQLGFSQLMFLTQRKRPLGRHLVRPQKLVSLVRKRPVCRRSVNETLKVEEQDVLFTKVMLLRTSIYHRKRYEFPCRHILDEHAPSTLHKRPPGVRLNFDGVSGTGAPRVVRDLQSNRGASA